ncbi:MAG: SDR family NAD(P)-dependent oxidoreductase [Bacteroidales bacterium]
MNSNQQIKDKLTLITGASSGIGEQAALELSKRGTRVILIARNSEKLMDLAEKIINAGGRAFPFSIDLSDYKQVIEITNKIKNEIGIPDIIVNNAGAGIWKSTEETEWEEISTCMTVPYFGAFYIVKAFLPEMMARKSGQIVNMTSYAGFIAFAGATAYIVSRKAMIGFHEALTADLQGTGIICSLAYFAKVQSTYWTNNPGSEERLPGAQVLVPVITPNQAAKALVNGIINRRRKIFTPPVLVLFDYLIRFSPCIARLIIYKTGYKRKAINRA